MSEQLVCVMGVLYIELHILSKSHMTPNKHTFKHQWFIIIISWQFVAETGLAELKAKLVTSRYKVCYWEPFWLSCNLELCPIGHLQRQKIWMAIGGHREE